MRGRRRAIEGKAGGDAAAGAASVDPPLIEKWALGYLERFASSAENLRRVLLRRARRRLGPDTRLPSETAAEIAALVARYRDTGLIADAEYAAAPPRPRLRPGP